MKINLSKTQHSSRKTNNLWKIGEDKKSN